MSFRTATISVLLAAATVASARGITQNMRGRELLQAKGGLCLLEYSDYCKIYFCADACAAASEDPFEQSQCVTQCSTSCCPGLAQVTLAYTPSEGSVENAECGITWPENCQNWGKKHFASGVPPNLFNPCTYINSKSCNSRCHQICSHLYPEDPSACGTKCRPCCRAVYGGGPICSKATKFGSSGPKQCTEFGQNYKLAADSFVGPSAIQWASLSDM